MKAFRLSWSRLLRVAAVVEMILLFIVGLVLLDREAIAFAVLVAATSAWILLRRRSRVAVLIRGLVFLDVEFFMLTATVSNVTHHESLGPVVAPLALTITSAVGIVAPIAFLASRGRSDAPIPAAAGVGILAVVLFVAGFGYSATSGLGQPQQSRSGDLVISAINAKFSTASLRAPSGQVTVYMTNNDLFWHTFTIEKMGVEMRVPVKGHRTVTFDVRPGTYEYICAIPGHTAAGMHGVLTVK